MEQVYFGSGLVRCFQQHFMSSICNVASLQVIKWAVFTVTFSVKPLPYTHQIGFQLTAVTFPWVMVTGVLRLMQMSKPGSFTFDPCLIVKLLLIIKTAIANKIQWFISYSNSKYDSKYSLCSLLLTLSLLFSNYFNLPLLFITLALTF